MKIEIRLGSEMQEFIRSVSCKVVASIEGIDFPSSSSLYCWRGRPVSAACCQSKECSGPNRPSQSSGFCRIFSRNPPCLRPRGLAGSSSLYGTVVKRGGEMMIIAGLVFSVLLFPVLSCKSFILSGSFGGSRGGSKKGNS